MTNGSRIPWMWVLLALAAAVLYATGGAPTAALTELARPYVLTPLDNLWQRLWWHRGVEAVGGEGASP